MTTPRRHLSMLRSYTPADALTIGNAACGTIAIFLCVDYLAAGGARRSCDGKGEVLRRHAHHDEHRHVALLGAAFVLSRIDRDLWFGAWQAGPAVFHPLTLVCGASGSAMISATLRVPKP